MEARIEGLLKTKGHWHRLSSRTKEVDSLLRKILRDPANRYNDLWDRAGVRIVVRFKEDITVVVSLIEGEFQVVRKKEFALLPHETGYQGTHCVVRLKADDPDQALYGDCICEIQVRTLSQDLWSEMAHELSYKAVTNIPHEMQRRINILSGLIEMADNEFSRLNREITNLPEVRELKILEALQRQFWKLSARPWDKALSVEVVKALRPLYGEINEGEWTVYFERFYEERKDDLKFIFEQQRDLGNRSAFLFQPEVLMIFDRLSVDPDAVQHIWKQHFPERELEKLAALWGLSLG